MVSSRLDKFTQLLRRWKESSTNTVQEWRDGLDYMASRVNIPRDVAWEGVSAGGVPAEWITTPNACEDRTILHYHGGGWVAGSVKNAREFCGRLGRITKARVISVDYRLAPEHPYPGGPEDAFTAYRWVLGAGVSPKRLLLAGESAGGNLVLTTLLRAKAARLPMPAGALLFSPGTDLAGTGASYETKGEEDPWLSVPAVKMMSRQYLAGADPRDPAVSPLYADLKGLPPLFVQVGTAEILLNDSLQLAERAKQAGVSVTLDVIEGGIHAMALFLPIIPEVAKAQEKVTQFALEIFGN